MPYELLFVEHAGTSSDFRLSDLLEDQADFRCERTTWSAFHPDKSLDHKVQLIVAVAFPGLAEPMSFFRWVAKNRVAIPILGILPESVRPEQLQEISRSVDDFVLWPVKKMELGCRASRLLRPEQLQQETSREALRQEAAFSNMIGDSPQFVGTVRRVPFIASSDAPVLLFGETGTGKELFAHAIHQLSERNAFPFIPVECGAVPENLVENELFGHTRGAYTDAHADHKGLAAAAEGGTIFLDEIDALSLAAQAKLLRFIQEGTYRALGSEKLTSAHVRIIAATNRDLQSESRQGRFRLDLYFRLNVLNLRLPSLRERPGDVDLLARYFLRNLCDGKKNKTKTFSPASLRMLEYHTWPGNVRELFSVVQRAYVFCEGTQILPRHLTLHTNETLAEPVADNFRAARACAVQNFERSYIESLLEIHGGNVTHAARAAGKDRRAFGRLVKKYALKSPVVANDG